MEELEKLSLVILSMIEITDITLKMFEGPTGPTTKFLFLRGHFTNLSCLDMTYEETSKYKKKSSPKDRMSTK